MPHSLRRFFVDASFSGEETTLQLSPRETYHLSKVLRLNAGDRCQVFNQKGWRAEAVIERISETEGAQIRLRKISPAKENLLYLKVGQSLPQKKKLDELVEKAEELSVQEFWVLETRRTQVRMQGEARDRARKRWERIVIEAAKQSGSPVLMKVEGPFAFEKVLEEKLSPADRAFLFHPDPKGLPFSSLMERLKPLDVKSRAGVFLFFGPEGGFTDEEIRLAESRGVQKVFLGPSTLRLETAFLGTVSAIRFLMG